MAYSGETGAVSLCVAVLLLSLWPAHRAYTVHVSGDEAAATHGDGGALHTTQPAAVAATAGKLGDKQWAGGDGACGGACSGGGNTCGGACSGSGGTCGGTCGGGVGGTSPWWDTFGMSSMRASPVLPWLFVCTVAMQALATLVSLAFNQYLEAG